MTQKGAHTWDLVVHYHRCPTCGFIIESRENYKYQLGKYIKQLECNRCHHYFTEIKQTTAKFGPLTGKPEPAEIDWK